MSAALESRNPATGDLVRRYDPHDAAEVEARLERAARAAPTWAATPAGDRAALLLRVADLLDRGADGLARLMTTEMGKTLAAARAEVAKCALACRHYAAHAGAYLAPEEVEGSDGRVELHPLGAVLAVMPWNFPLWQVIRFAAPALLAGNVGLLKHASNVPGCALALEELFTRAGAPAGVFQTLLVGAGAALALIADDRVAAATVTGSEGAGRAVATAAGKRLKKVVLELGGSDAFVVLPDADLDRAAATAVKARCVNNGQSCIAAKRFVVAAPVYDRFLDAFVAGMRALRMGDPMDAATELGPLATARIRDELHGQVQRSIAAGARVACGGAPRPGPGWFYPPTVLTDVPAAAPAYREELFGPVAAVLRADDAGHALALANDSRYGLAASVWTTDRAAAEHFARGLACGTVFVNEMVASDPRYPFGGVKCSGHGRELALHGLREFCNVKTIRLLHLERP